MSCTIHPGDVLRLDIELVTTFVKDEEALQILQDT